MKKLIALLLLVSFGLLGGVPVYAADTNLGGLSIDSASDPATTAATKVFKVLSAVAAEVFSITAGGVVTAAGAITASSVTATTITGTTIVATQYVQLLYTRASLRPASGAPAGSMIMLYDATNSSDCGTAGNSTSFVVCKSNGTNWFVV